MELAWDRFFHAKNFDDLKGLKDQPDLKVSAVTLKNMAEEEQKSCRNEKNQNCFFFFFFFLLLMIQLSFNLYIPLL